MSRLKAANNAQTALAALMDATATTCTVVNGDILPAVPFRASIDSEIIEVGAKAGNNLSSILRGQEGTAAAAHQSGSLVEGKMTAGMHNELLSTDEVIKNNYAATTAPTVNDDSSAGYTVGSTWIDIANDAAYVCLDASTGAAVWSRITGLAAHETSKAAHVGYVPACSAYISSAQSVPSSTVTAIALNAEDYDTDSMHDVSTNNSRITCKTAGLYAISAQVEFASNATGVRQIFVSKNGTQAASLIFPNMGSVTNTQINASFPPISLSVNDYIELNVWQNSGGSLNVSPARLAVVRVG